MTWLAIAVVAGCAVALRTGIGWVMRKYGIAPADPGARSRGFGDVIDKLRERRDRVNHDRESKT